MTFGVLAAVAASSSASNDVAPGVLGFLVVAAMGVALVFLLRSMNKQFRKITPTADAPGNGGSSQLSGGSGGSSPPSQLSGGSGGSSPPSQHRGESEGSSPPSQREPAGPEVPK